MFCPNCGKQLNEGETCSCQQQNADGQQQTPPDTQAQQPQQNIQQDTPPQAQQNTQQQYQQYQPQGNAQQAQQQQYQQYQPVNPNDVESQNTNVLAIIGFVCSLVGIFFNIASIAAVILCAIALGQINRTGATGKGFAVAGLVIGIIVLVIYIIVIAACASVVGGLSALGSFY